jgi:tRNA dimethylallyltransferase
MKIPVITGPTAAGKTAIVLGFAEKYDIEIISADAYQVYKYMNIGTAKPDEEELAKVPHHMINVLTPDMTYSAGVFFEEAEKIIKDILARGKIPFVAGGTGMYVETLQKGIFAGPERDEKLRAEIVSMGDEKGYDYLYNLLCEQDPTFAAKIKSADKTRILRGLEINKLCGMNVEEAQKKYHQNPQFEYDIFVLNEDRQVIYDKINRRVDIMFEMGWVDEVRNLLDMGYDESMDSFKAIGYREITRSVKEGTDPLLNSDKIKKNTRNFAKRQLTWFRHMDGISYIDPSSQEDIKRCEKCIFA